MIHSDEKYAIKMRKKKELFDCLLLSTIEEIDLFFDGVCCAN